MTGDEACDRARERLVRGAGSDDHLRECAGCRAFAAALGRVDRVLLGGDAPPAPIPAGLHAGVMQRIVERHDRREDLRVIGPLAVLLSAFVGAGIVTAVAAWGLGGLEAPASIPLLEGAGRILSRGLQAAGRTVSSLPVPSPRTTMLAFSVVAASGISLLLDRLAREV